MLGATAWPHASDGTTVGHDSPPPAVQPTRKVTRRVRLFIACFSIILLAALAAAGIISHSAAVSQAEKETESVVALVAHEAERLVESADLILEQMVDIAGRTDWNDPKSVDNTRQQMVRFRASVPGAYRMFVIDRTGKVRTTTMDALRPDLDVSKRDYFLVHKDAEIGMSISGPIVTLSDQSLIFVISRRLSTADGAFDGVATMSVSPATVGAYYRSLSTTTGSVFVWAKADGNVIVREPAVSPEQFIDDHLGPDLLGLIQRKPGVGRGDYISPYDGKRRIAFYHRVGKYPLYVIVGLSRGQLLLQWIDSSWAYFLFAALALLGLGAASLYTLRWAAAEDLYRAELTISSASLERSNSELESRVAERTAQLSAALREREALLAQKDLLMREVNHRVKNSLQIVSSLLHLQESQAGNPQLRQQLGEAVGRVAAIARVHEHLHQGEVEAVCAAEYLGTLCHEIQQSTLAHDRLWRISLQAEPVKLPTDKAVLVGLIANELITNALKYGHPATASGARWQVEIAFDLLPDGRKRLSVRDFGSGFPENPPVGAGGGLGGRIVHALAEQLGGSILMENAAPGARVALVY